MKAQCVCCALEYLQFIPAAAPLVGLGRVLELLGLLPMAFAPGTPLWPADPLVTLSHWFSLSFAFPVSVPFVFFLFAISSGGACSHCLKTNSEYCPTHFAASL